MTKPAAIVLSLCSFAAFSFPASAADCGRTECGWDSAAAYCKKNGGNLPTIDDLLQAWEAKCTGGRKSDLCSGWYWSSREMNATEAWGVSFREGAADFYKKTRTAPVFCGPKRKPGAPAAKKAAAPAATGARCAAEQCTWGEAAAYCRGPGLYKMKAWYDVCRAECKNGETGANCKRWYWLGESESPNYAYSGTCDSPADASVHSVEKTSTAYARCAPAAKPPRGKQ